MLYLEFIEIMSSCTSILGREKCSRFDIEKLIFAPQDDKGTYSFKYKGSKSNEVPVYLPASQAIRLISVKQKDEKLLPIYFLPSNWKIALSHSDNYPRLWQNVESYINKNTENIREINYEGLAGKLRSTEEVALFINKYLKNIPLDDKNFCMIGIFIGIQIIANEKVVEAPSDKLIKILTEKISSFSAMSGAVIKKENKDQKLLSSPKPISKTIYGRDKIIDDVAQQLKENHVIFLYGIGGIGKTQIAKNYVKKYSSNYDTIIYGTYPNTDNSKSNDEPNDGLKELLLSEDVFAFEPKMNRRVLSDGSLENDDDYAGRKLQKIKDLSNERTLIIVDNFDVMNDKLLSEFINGRYHLLITTRCSYENMYPMIKVKEIEDIDDIKQIFFKNYRCDIVTCDDPHLEELIELVNRHTYTIELIAKHMSNSGQSTLEMIDLLKKEGIICLNEEIRNDDCSTEVAFENLKKMFKIFRLSDEEKQILQYMCLMPLSGVKKSDFKRWAGLKSLSKVNNLIDRSWIIQNTNGIALHPIIRDVVRKQLPLTNDNIEFFIINFINDMNDVHNTLRKHHLIYRERKIHLDIAETLIEKITSEKLLYDQLRFIYAYCVFDTGNSNRAVQLFEELLQTSNNLAFKLNCYEKVIQNYVLLGEAAIAVEIALKAYEEVKPFAANINSPDIGRHYICLLHRLIEAYRLLGDYEKSLYYGTLCLSQSDKFFEIYKDDLTAWTKYHIGRTLVLKGEPCEEFLKEAMEVFLSNQDDLAVANCNDILALVYKQKGLFVEALTINEEAYKMHTHLLGNFHIDIANNQKWRGDIFLKMKKFDDAEKCYQNAILIYKNKNCRIHVEEVIAILNYIKHMKNLEE